MFPTNFGTNNNKINESNVDAKLMRSGIIFPRGKDIDDKTLFIFRVRLYTRGSCNVNDMKRTFVYWLERLIRESNDDYLTFMFELTGAKVINVDRELTSYIISTLKDYYPYSLNYILVYDLPWILVPTFRAIKFLLPAKAVDRLKLIDNGTITDFIKREHILVAWGGEDDYTFEFVPEERQPKMIENNNSINHKNNNNNTNSNDNNNNIRKHVRSIREGNNCLHSHYATTRLRDATKMKSVQSDNDLSLFSCDTHVTHSSFPRRINLCPFHASCVDIVNELIRTGALMTSHHALNLGSSMYFVNPRLPTVPKASML
ncbi:motile sperm domain-containing protein 2-like [Uranotaenia lowii]|uniref:motile sperm domain-containing protein 2-like n=1 Tax=Uranotaenia lowii TaxID=190385 RepID=UPI00247A0B93|nr:motile sperm domain-containing protein 2-like [Uranotaenia lowii]